jgi:hypothetical protein
MTKLWLTLALVPSLALAAPKPAARLDNLVGTWKGSGSLTAGKDHLPLTFGWQCKQISAAAGVLCTLEIKGMPAPYAETDLFGYEPNTDTLHWFSVTNAGETHDHVAKAADGKLQFVFKGTQDGKPLVETIDFDLGKELTIRSEVKVGDQTQAVLEAKGKKA